MNKEIVFLDGLLCKIPHEKAPDFVKMDISFKTDDFIKFLEKHRNNNGYVNAQIKVGKSGKAYAQLNTWKPEKQKEEKTEEINADDLIPF